MDYSLPGSSVHGDSLDKNTGVGCYALLQGIFPTQGSNLGFSHYRWILYCLRHQYSSVQFSSVQFSRSVVSDSLRPHESQHTRPPCSSRSPGVHSGKPKNTGVGSLFLLQVNFPNQKSNWGLLHYRHILYQLSHQGSPNKNVMSYYTLIKKGKFLQRHEM